MSSQVSVSALNNGAKVKNLHIINYQEVPKKEAKPEGSCKHFELISYKVHKECFKTDPLPNTSSRRFKVSRDPGFRVRKFSVAFLDD